MGHCAHLPWMGTRELLSCRRGLAGKGASKGPLKELGTWSTSCLGLDPFQGACRAPALPFQLQQGVCGCESVLQLLAAPEPVSHESEAREIPAVWHGPSSTCSLQVRFKSLQLQQQMAVRPSAPRRAS